MKDLYTVLRQKEEDVRRIRREIQSLLTVIPLLADEQPSPDIMRQLRTSSGTSAEHPDESMAQLQNYFPFTNHLGKSKHL